jgi:hypothetical protein
MITKQQLDTVYREVEELERLWRFNNKKSERDQRQPGNDYHVSHRLLGLLLQTYATSSDVPVIARFSFGMKKLDNIEREKEREKPTHDPKTGRFIKGHRGFSR